VPFLFGAAIFLGAALLFVVEPMSARTALPLLGGGASVWTACMLFFQSALLAGYLYAHRTTRLPARAQLLVHTALLALALLVLALPGGPPGDPSGRPTGWLVLNLARTIGLPFVALAATSPLLSRWFSRTGRDPYFLYAVSNAGSLFGLLAYPLLLEPLLPLGAQSRAWSAAFLLFVAMNLACVALTSRLSPSPSPALEPAPRPSQIPRRRRLTWLALAFVPSSLLLGVTTHISTDLAPVPLLWVLPLALYLVTFILAFSRAKLPIANLSTATALAAVAVAVVLVMDAKAPIKALIALHLAAFFVFALLCHRRLADDRPPPGALTTYFLVIALGGALGGLFNALVAPFVFRSILEYPLAISAVCLLRPGSAGRWVRALAPAAGIFAFVAVAGEALRRAGRVEGYLAPQLLVALPALACLLVLRSRVAFALAVAALLFAPRPLAEERRTLHAERTFFGVHRVFATGADGAWHVLMHGSTVHGVENMRADAILGHPPTTYFHRTGPIGDVFRLLDASRSNGPIAVVGLGAGTLAAYSRADRAMTFYEIDPAVRQIAEDPALFTYLYDARTRFGSVSIELGDGRVNVGQAPDRSFALIIVDAFSSDAIPIHLITREAVALYEKKLEPGGLIAFHVTNRHLALAPVVARVAEALGLVAVRRIDDASPAARAHDAKRPSEWVVVAEDIGRVGMLLASDWHELGGDDAALWTDDFSNLLGAVCWGD
jgi:hypothetical protein